MWELDLHPRAPLSSLPHSLSPSSVEHACLSSPCMNGATCVENPAGFTCICTSSWTGASCTDGDSDQWCFHSLILQCSITQHATETYTVCNRVKQLLGYVAWGKKVVHVWDKSNLRSYLCSKRDPSSHINRMHTCLQQDLHEVVVGFPMHHMQWWL